jgi:predicted lipoprotein
LGKLDQLAETVPNKLSNALASGNYLAGKDPQREKVNAHKLEAWRSGHTLSNLHANMTGIKLLLDDGGFLAMLKTQGQTALATQIRDQIEVVQGIEFAGSDLFQQLQDKQTQAADTFYTESLKLSQQIKQLSSALGIQLGFNDSDGD